MVAALTAVFVAGCTSAPDPDSVGTGALTVAATGSDVSAVLAHLYSGALARTGAETSVVEVDDRQDALTGLDDGSISLLADFSGDLLAELDPASSATEPDAVFEALARSLPEWLSVSDYAAAENRETVSVSSSTASALDEATMAGLAPLCGSLVAAVGSGLSPEEAVEPLAEVYGCRFASTIVASGTPEPDATTVTVVPATEVGSDDADADTVTLADSDQAYTARNVTPLFRKGLLSERNSTALTTLAGELTTADVADLVVRVRAGESAAVAADRWLDTRTL